MSCAFRVAESTDDQAKAFAVRAIVFCGEQGIGYALERDGQDASAVHVLGEIAGEPVAAGRVRFVGGYAKLERIAVRKPYRGKHIGRQLTDFMVSAARTRGFRKCKVHAQVQLEKFYAAHGFRTQGDRFFEAGLEHCLMVREEQ